MDEIKGSLKDFLAQRALQKTQAAAPEPKPEPAQEVKPSPEVRSKPTPVQEPSQTKVTTKPPSLLRRLAGEAVSAALRDTGQIQSHASSKVVGKGRTTTTRSVGAPGDGTKVSLSKPGVGPKGLDLGVTPDDVEGLEDQIRKVDVEVKDLGSYFKDEIRKVRGDVEAVNVVASDALAAIQKLRKDQRDEEFRRKVLASRLRPVNDDPDALLLGGRKAEDSPGLLGTIANYLKYGAAGLGGGVATKVLSKALGKVGLRTGTKAGVAASTDVLERLGVREGTSVGAKVLGTKALQTIAKGKGSWIGVVAEALTAMKADSQTGNHLRTKLRSALGIEDPGERWDLGGPDSRSNAEYDELKSKEASKVKVPDEKRSTDSDTDVERDHITLRSTGDFSMSSLRTIKLDSNDQVTLKAVNKIILDAKRIEFKGMVEGLEGVQATTRRSSPSARKTIVNDPDLTRAQTQYDEDVEKYGKEKADALLSTRDRSALTLDGLAERATNFMSGKGFRTTASRVKKAKEEGGASSGRFKGGTNTALAMASVMDQLRKEGVPEANLKHAAAALVGQAIAESNLNPDASHDGGTGYGIYGARLERRDRMLSWLNRNGYEKNSLEGQSKYMAHEVMTDKSYKASRSALMTASPETLRDTNKVLTDNFEAPKFRNYGPRLNASQGALETGIGDTTNVTSETAPKEEKGVKKIAGGPDPDQKDRPHYIHGIATMDGFEKPIHWGSGGAGRGSIPYGDYPITPNTIGAWGQSHGAIGLNNNTINDPKYPGRPRAGIEIHASSSSDLERLYTEGCFAVPREEWPEFKRHLLTEIARNGPMYLHIGRDGSASLTHSPTGASSGSDRDLVKVDQDVVQPPAGTSRGSDGKLVVPSTKEEIEKSIAEAKRIDAKTFSNQEMDAKDAAWFSRRSKTKAEEIETPAPVQGLDSNEKDSTPHDTNETRTIPDAEVSKSIPTPSNLDEWNKEGAGEKLTESIKDDDSKPKKEVKDDVSRPDSSVTSSSRPPVRASRREHHDIEDPVNHPESESPRPGSNGYGDKAYDPDQCDGICQV